MRTLLAKILFAQVVTVVSALLVVMAITRANLSRGFIDFLERQESAVLNSLAPALAEIYEAQGGWDFLREQPDNWQSILRQTRSLQPNPAGRGPMRLGRLQQQGAADLGLPPPVNQPLRWLRSLDRLQLRDRLFLLDADHAFLAGAPLGESSDVSLEAVLAQGQTVGWVGFVPMGNVLPPEAERFLLGQVRVLSASLLTALVVAAALGFVLARHLSRPVRQLADTVAELSNGHYERRAGMLGSDEIGRLAQAVNGLAETLEKNRSARHRWMADIAHELRTPVAILKGEIEALADGVRQPDSRTVASLCEEIQQLAVLIDDLQTLALSDAGALNLRREHVELGNLVQQVSDSFRDRLAGRGVRLELELNGALDLMGDSSRLRQLLNNLLENGVRYVEQDGWVRIRAERRAGIVHLMVEDSGPGVADEVLNMLFERFYRVEQGRSRAGGGSGLGLSICRNIVEAHGGSIRAGRSPAGGLGIYVDLPG